MATSELLKTELNTFEQHRQELVAQAEGQFALVRDGNVIGTYMSQADAIAEGYRRFGNVPFLVKQIVSVDVPTDYVSNILAL